MLLWNFSTSSKEKGFNFSFSLNSSGENSLKQFAAEEMNINVVEELYCKVKIKEIYNEYTDCKRVWG